MWWLESKNSDDVDLIFGIDQSLKSTAVCCYDVRQKMVTSIKYHGIEEDKIKISRPLELRQNKSIIWYQEIEQLVENICGQIRRNIVGYKTRLFQNNRENYDTSREIRVAVLIEKPNEGTSGGYEIIYRLGMLHMMLNYKLTSIVSAPIINVHSATWKAMFFQEDNTNKMTKELLHQFFFEKRLKNYGITLPDDIRQSLNDDGRDAIGLVVFMLYYMEMIENSKKDKKTLFNHYCGAVKGSKLCFHCKYLHECKEMQKKIPSERSRVRYPIYKLAREMILKYY